MEAGIRKSPQLARSLACGVRLGISTTWMLMKVTLPVYVVISLLGATPVLGYVAGAFSPLMEFFGLPGEAAMVLVIGNALSLYAAIGAIKALTLTGGQITVLALMLSFSHNLFVETALCRKLGVSPMAVVSIRMTLAVISGLTCRAMGIV